VTTWIGVKGRRRGPYLRLLAQSRNARVKREREMLLLAASARRITHFEARVILENESAASNRRHRRHRRMGIPTIGGMSREGIWGEMLRLEPLITPVRRNTRMHAPRWSPLGGLRREHWPR
jgi:hypothetical protein